jgi:hypothetical protein
MEYDAVYSPFKPMDNAKRYVSVMICLLAPRDKVRQNNATRFEQRRWEFIGWAWVYFPV